jgi:hemerythrin-like metal-binding protein
MAFFDWDNTKFSVENSELDLQHKKLFEIVNKLYDLSKVTPPHKINNLKVLDELANYTSYHFDCEERYMAEIGYPYLESHKLTHEALIERVNDILEKFKESPTGAITSELLNFVKMWLTGHIQGIDIKYSEHTQPKDEAA